MKHIGLMVMTGVVGALLSGCGSISTTAPVTSQAGSASFSVQWPAPGSHSSRLIPAASNSIRFVVTSGPDPTTGVLAGVVMNRPTTPPYLTTATLSGLPAGSLYVAATAYPMPGAQGIAQASASSSLVVQPGQVTSVVLNLTSTISSLIVSGTGISGSSGVYTLAISAGSSTQLSVTPVDTSGNTVLVVPGNVQWLSDNPSVASVTATGGSVTLSAGVAGTAHITVTEIESGQSSSITVTVQ